MNTDNIDVLLKIRNDLKEQKKIFTENNIDIVFLISIHYIMILKI